MSEHVLILGGGLAGMSCALQCARAGARVTVLEREEQVGGLARSFTERGFTFDFGPHRLFSKNDELVKNIQDLLGHGLVLRERKSRIFLKGRFFHYPLRVGNAVFSMPVGTTARILLDYAAVKLAGLVQGKEDRSFEDWVTARFGRTLYEIFFKEYTEKAWGIPCSQISAEWASQRISLLSLWDTFVKSVWRRGNQPRTYASQFSYPQRGGIGILARRMAEEVERCGGKVLTAAPVTGLTVSAGRIRTVAAGGKLYEADQVISTIPVSALAGLFRPAAPAAVLAAAARLQFRAIVFVYLFLNRPEVSDDHWIYLPEQRFLSNRISESRNFSSENVPPGQTVICAEVTCRVGDSLWNTCDNDLAERVGKDMLGLGFAAVRPEDIIGVRTIRAPEAYPIYDIGYQDRLRTVLNFGESFSNFVAIGRSALFRYNNMDHSIEMGIRAAAAAVGDGDRRAVTRVAAGQQYFG